MTTIINRFFGIVLDLSSIMTKNALTGVYEYNLLLEYLYSCESECFTNSGYQSSMPIDWNPISGLPIGTEQKIIIVVPYQYYDIYTTNINDIYNIFKDPVNFNIFKSVCVGHCYLIVTVHAGFASKTLVGIYTLCTHFKNISGFNAPEITPFRQRVRRDTANFTSPRSSRVRNPSNVSTVLFPHAEEKEDEEEDEYEEEDDPSLNSYISDIEEEENTSGNPLEYSESETTPNIQRRLNLSEVESPNVQRRLNLSEVESPILQARMNLTPILQRLSSGGREESKTEIVASPQITTPNQPTTSVSILRQPGPGWGSIVMECIIDSILSNYPIEAIIWLGVEINNNPYFAKAISVYTKFGFDNPILTNTDPFGKTYSFYFISLHRQNKYMFINDIDSVSAFNHVLYTINERVKRGTNSAPCSMNFYFEKFYAIYLERLCFTTLSVKNNVISQKEIAGEFIINKLYCQLNNHQKCPINWVTTGTGTPPDFLWEISYNKDTILYKDVGTEHGVTIANASYFTFHTHPKNTYVLYNTTIGYPSGTDYKFVLNNYKTTIFHAVISMEGIYIISFTNQFLLFIYEQSSKPYGKPIPLEASDLQFIENHYDKDKAIFQAECISKNIINLRDQINQYIIYINNYTVTLNNNISVMGELTGLPDGTQGPVKNISLFNVNFKSWNEIYNQDASSVFNIKYSCLNNQCLINEKIRDSVIKLYEPSPIPEN